MDKKKAEAQKGKTGVKFADSKGKGQDQQLEEKPKKIKGYKDLQFCKDFALKAFNESDSLFKLYTKNDPDVKRKDTAKGLCKILDSLKEALQNMNEMKSNDKEKLYYLIYNGTIYVYEICRALRKSVYSSLAIQYIAFILLCMEANIVLLGIKFLDWRVKLYVELAHLYEECESFKAASKTIEIAIQKVTELKSLEDSDPPVPEYIEKIFQNNFRILRALELKYKLHIGALTADLWKKKVDEYYSNDFDGRNLAIIESLNVHVKKNSNIINHSGKIYTWKDQVLTFSYEMVKSDIELVAKSLQQMDEKMKMTIDIKENMQYTNEQRTELIVKAREFDMNMVNEKDWKKASNNAPFELHVDLIKHAYDLGNTKIYSELVQTAIIRCKYRRIEVPYIVDIDLLVSSIPHTNIPNSYEKIPIDINEAHLRGELAKLRLLMTKELAKQQEEKRLEDAALKKKTTEKTIKTETIEKPSLDPDPMNVTHNYIYFVIKRSYLPDKAICAIDVVMANEEKGPVVKEGWRAIAIPISQYTGVRETTKKIPFLLLKHSQESLKDDEEKKTLLIDFLPLLCKSYLARPPFGYDRLNLDLRQVPQQFYRIPNLDFVFLAIKTDRFYSTCERELQILMNLNELEKSHKGDKATNPDEEIKAHLDINYDLDKLLLLAQTLKKSLSGPLGDAFFNARQDFLIKLSFYIWQKYCQSTFYQIDTLYDLKITDEISEEAFTKYMQFVTRIKSILTEVLESINQILKRIEAIDPIWLAKTNIELCKLLEESSEYKKASQILRYTLNRITAYRDEILNRGVESKNDFFLPFSITCNNHNILEMIEKMKITYYDWKAWLRKEIRSKLRQSISKKPLDAEEADEEDYEYTEAVKAYIMDDGKDAAFLASIEFEKPFIEYIGIINTLHSDIMINLLRCEVKAGKQTYKNSKLKAGNEMMTKTGKSPEELSGVPDRLKAKMTIMYGPTARQVQSNASKLQLTLQNAGKLEVPKPKIAEYEKALIAEAGSNVYANALLYMTLAGNRSKLPEQKYLLKEAFEFIKEAEEEESMHINNGVQNAVFLFSTFHDNIVNEKLSKAFYPFNYLYNQDYIKSTSVPPKPILVSRNTNSITLKLPPFNPIIPEMSLLENPNLKIVKTMALYGKISAHGVDVSLTSTDLQNTGIRFQNGDIITVPNLRINEKYCFAVAGYNPNENVINGIGKTGEDIAAIVPLPINILYAYLAKISYQIGDFELSEKAAEKCANFFMMKTEMKDRSLDYADCPAYLYRIKGESLKFYTQHELRIAAENFIVLARVYQRKYSEIEGNSKTPLPPIQKQKYSLRICNYLLLSLEMSSAVKSYIMSKKIIKELYNNVLPFLNYKTKTRCVLHLLIKAQILVSQIPKEIWDNGLRTASIKLAYEIIRMTQQINEIKLSKLVLYYNSRLPHKKWFLASKTIMVMEEIQPNPDDKKKTQADSKKTQDAKGKKGPATEEKPPANSPEPKLIPKLIKELFEKENLQDFFEESLIAIGEDYFEAVNSYVELWKEQLDFFKPLFENGNEIVEQKKSQLSIKFDFWESLRDHTTAFAKLQATYKTSPYYIEFSCKLLKRLLEKNMDIKQVIDYCNQITEPVSDHIKLLNDIKDLKYQAYIGDIAWNPGLLDELIEEKEINKGGNEIAIEIFTKYNALETDLSTKVKALQSQYYYDLKWLAEFNFLKAVLLYLQITAQVKEPKENQYDVYFDINEMDLDKTLNQYTENNLDGNKKKWDNTKLDQFTNIFKHLANVCTYAFRGEYPLILQNTVKFIMNMMRAEIMEPFMHEKTDLYKYITLIHESLTQMLITCRANYQKSSPSPKVAIENTKTQEGKTVTIASEVSQSKKIRIPSNYTLLETTLRKDFWFQEIEEPIDVSNIANFAAYCIQALLVEKKWNVIIEVSKQFCNVTCHYYSVNILNFTVHSQNQLYDVAKKLTINKRQELEDRTKTFEIWREANKKKKSRQLMLTGEIPPEQLEYEREANELNRQINLLKNKEDFLKDELNRSELVLKNINRDENQALKELSKCKKALAKYGYDTKMLFLSEKSTPEDPTSKDKKKNNRMYSHTLIQRYRAALDTLKKKQENFASVQALHDLGNLNFSVGNTSNAEENWNDALDTIFQQIYSLKSFRKVIGSFTLLAHQLGVQRCLIGSIILSKLSYLCYENDLHLQRECALMAFELIFSIFKISLPHAFIAIQYCEYRVKEIIENDNIFGNKYVLNPAELILSCNKIAFSLLDIEKYVMVLPVAALMEYIATDIVKQALFTPQFSSIKSKLFSSSFFSIRAKILKAIASAHLGNINEAYFMLMRVTSEKDLPLPFIKKTEFLKKENGFNCFNITNQYYTELSPDHEKNKEALDSILKLEVSKNFKFSYGFYNSNLFYYAKSAIIHAIYDNEFNENSEIRLNNLRKAETILRGVLKRLSFEEELSFLKNVYNNLEISLEQEPQAEKGPLEAKKQEIYTFMSQSNIEPSEQDLHFLIKDIPMTSPETREERISMMCRTRYLLHLINFSLNFHSRSYFILRDAILNLKKYSDDLRGIETGEEKENQQEIKAPEDGKDSKKKAAVEKPADKKDATKKGGKDSVQTEDQDRKAQEEKKRKLDEEIRFYKLQASERRTRNTNNGFWWIKLRTEYCLLLLKQNKLTDCEMLLTTIKDDCKTLNDTFFIRTLDEIYGKIMLRRGKIEEAKQYLQKAISHGETYYHDDDRYPRLIGDYADLLNNSGNLIEAEKYYKQAAKIFRNILIEIKFEFKFQNINDIAIEEGIRYTPSLFMPPEIEVNISKIEKFKSKKEEKKGVKDDPNKTKKTDTKAKGKGDVPDVAIEIKADVLYPMPKDIDFSKENKYNLSLLDEKMASLTSSKLSINYYYKSIENYMRATLNSIRCSLEINNLLTEDQEGFILSTLEELERIIDNQFNVLFSLKFNLYLLYGKYYIKKFITEIMKIYQTYENKYLQQKVKKYKRLYERLPFRDLPRNKYMIETPNFSKNLKDNLLPFLDKARVLLEKCLKQVRSECLIAENDLKIEEGFLEMARVSLLQREYRPRPIFKYYSHDDLEFLIQQYKSEWRRDDLKDIKKEEFEKSLAQTLKEDQKACLDLEWEAFQYMNFAIQTSEAKKTILEKFSILGQANLTDPTKLPLDIYYNLIESDYQYKKTYDSKLFDESKRKMNVNSIDCLTLLNKYAKESMIFTFSNNTNQRLISKLHRYLKVNLTTYQKCLMQDVIAPLRSDGKALPEGSIIVKFSFNANLKEYSMRYMLGPLNKDKIKTHLSKDELIKLFLNEESNTLYGMNYFTQNEISTLMQDGYNLRQKMLTSDKFSQQIRERDYKYHKEEFLKLLAHFAFKFAERNASVKQSKKNQEPLLSKAAVDEDPLLILDKYEAIVPELTIENIDIFINIFSDTGINVSNHNYLGLLRYFHGMKYK